MVFLLIRNKKRIKKVVFGSIFLVVLLLSNIVIFYNFHSTNLNIFDNNNYEIDAHLSGKNLNEFINGTADDQEVRVYMQNQSTSYNNNNGLFNISAPGDNTYLTNGDFQFEFQNNFTTNYILENNNSIELKNTGNNYIKYN
ncbi:MAG: hypothetical protein EU550_01160, partial [Promethearchaeota archaeon]